MSSFTLDNDATSLYYGDLKVTNNSLTLNSSTESIRQHLAVRFQIFLGEWFLDVNVGVPWFRDILVKNPSLPVVQDALKDVILETQGVLELIKFDFDYSAATREVSLDFQCLSTDGIIDFSQVVEVGG